DENQMALDEANSNLAWLKSNATPADNVVQNFQNKMTTTVSDDINNNITDLDLPQEQKNQFFNPYGGYDIPTAAFKLGEFVESGNTLGKVGASLKILSGLGRNFMSGMGQMNREQFVLNEANQNRRDDLTQTQYAQQGGNVEQDKEWLVNWFNNPEA